MAIILSRSGKNARRLERTVIEQEDYLQEYVQANPDVLPIHELKEGVRLLVIAREFPTASGPIDALGLDQDGDVYLIETKLYKNSDKRRVIAQMLDYGAALAKTYTNSGELVAALDSRIQSGTAGGASTLLQEFFEWEPEDVGTYLETVIGNLGAGRVKFVVLMDRVDDRLKDLISFVNRSSNFAVLGVELDFYQDGEVEVLIPNLYGAEGAKSGAAAVPPTRKRQSWSAEQFLEDAERRLGPEARPSLETLLDWAQQQAEAVTWGSGVDVGTFNVKFGRISRRSVLTVWSDGTVSVNLGWLHDTEAGQRCADAMAAAVRRLGFADVPADFREKYPSIPFARWSDRVDELIGLVESAVEGA